MNNKTKLTAEPGKQEILIEREFDAPRELVFKAYTDPELYVQWIGPKGFETEMKKFEPKSGGTWQFSQRDKEDNIYDFHGVNHEVLFPERIIGTFEYDNLPEQGHVSLERAIFEELPDNRTKVTSKSVFFSVEDRDGMLGEGDMEKGLNESYERLDDLLETLK